MVVVGGVLVCGGVVGLWVVGGVLVCGSWLLVVCWFVGCLVYWVKVWVVRGLGGGLGVWGDGLGGSYIVLSILP